MSLGKICVRSVQVAEPSERVQKIAQRMAETGTGTVVVLDAERREPDDLVRPGRRIHEEDRER